jgi:predicted extracellular nuclease
MRSSSFLCVLMLASCASSDHDVSQATFALDAHEGLVIRQVYGGGGNSGATLTNDFVELFNTSDQTLSVAGLSVQYAAAKASFGTTRADVTPLPSLALLPGQSLLLLGAAGSGGSVAPPSPDVVDDTPLRMSGSAGRVALVEGVDGLACGAGTEPCDAAELARIVDLVGYGAGTTPSEGTPTRSTSNATAVVRAQGGCQDTNDNASDFELRAPEPRNAESPLRPCAGTGEPTQLELDAGVPEDDAPAQAGPVRIHDIQGATHRSPLVGREVKRVEGVVTALGEQGFWFEDPLPDADPATSEGLFVFTSSRPTVEVGERVLASGRVTEFRPACSSCASTTSAYDNLTLTQLGRLSELLVLERFVALPEPVLIGSGGRLPPLSRVDEGMPAGDVELVKPAFDVVHDGLDFHESLEGMRIALDAATAVGPTRDFTTTQEVPMVVPTARSRLTARGGLLLGEPGHGDDDQPERFHVSSLLVGHARFPRLDVGDGFAGRLVGVVDYGFGKFLLLPTELPEPTRAGLVRERVSLPATNAPYLDVATFNLENLGGTDEEQRFQDFGAAIVERLGSPDLVAVQEIQDDSGDLDDGVTTSAVTSARLIDAITAAGGPRYAYRDIAPMDGEEGGKPGGNIRVGLLFRSDRGLAFVEREGGASDVGAEVLAVNATAQLSASPGRISPSDPAFEDSRRPLVAELSFAGERLFVVVNHWSSKGGDDPAFGRFQPPLRSSEAQREAQAELVTRFVKSILAVEPSANVLVLGDLNDFRYSTSVSRLVDDAGFVNLIDTLPENERYAYVYQGVSQLLDHMIVSEAMFERAVGMDVVRFNAEFADQLSDHDPLVARFVFDDPTDEGESDSTDGPGHELPPSWLAWCSLRPVNAGPTQELWCVLGLLPTLALRRKLRRGGR